MILTDFQVLIFFSGEIISGFVLLRAGLESLIISRGWNAGSNSEQQIILERRTWLVSAGLYYVAGFNLILSILFLQLVNNHLPGVIQGAMCAAGVLELNTYGYPSLWLKLAQIPVLAFFLLLNWLDRREPEFPLTPLKYYLLLPLAVLWLSGLFTGIAFFGSLEPEVIATCCSISFEAARLPGLAVSFETFGAVYWRVLLYLLPVLIFLLNRYRSYVAAVLFSLIWSALSLATLKGYFVKFIYARPTHDCLYDILWWQYYGIGYVLYVLLFSGLVSQSFLVVWPFLIRRLKNPPEKLEQSLKRLVTISQLLYLIVVSTYWWYWIFFRT